MTTDLQLRTGIAARSNLAVQPNHAIRNIAELLLTMAVDWHVPGHRRTLHGRKCGHKSTAFVRTPAGDIPVDSGAYSMNGFIRFETRYMFPDMFETESSEDGDYRTAVLTEKGVEFANLGVLDYHRWDHNVRECEFFCPPAAQIQQDPQLPAPTLLLAERLD